MITVRSFAPVARADAKLLILGSMPGKKSLQENQYYANRHNLFWAFMGELFGAGRELPYQQRLLALQASGVALWDVLQECSRAGSLDADIVENSIVPNDFAGFFARHRAIRRIYFNGSKAEQAFRKYVLPGLAGMEGVELLRLPSTSPANASIPPDRKLELWKKHLTADER